MLKKLATIPVPIHDTFCRGVYVWVPASPNDPLETLVKRQALIDFCGTYNVNMIFLDIYRYLGAANWTEANAAVMRQFLSAAHASGIQVHAMAGDVGWGQFQSWVMTHVVRPIVTFNSQAVSAGQRFDGLHFDVEYWTDPVTYIAQDHCTGLCDLMHATRQAGGPGFKVSCFAPQYLKDNTATRADVLYRGKLQQDGAHFMDEADFVVVATYSDVGATQVAFFQAWYDYASQVGVNAQLMAASETTNVAPPEITYFGDSKATMEGSHGLISTTFRANGDSVFLGQVVHDFPGWNALA